MASFITAWLDDINDVVSVSFRSKKESKPTGKAFASILHRSQTAIVDLCYQHRRFLSGGFCRPADASTQSRRLNEGKWQLCHYRQVFVAERVST